MKVGIYFRNLRPEDGGGYTLENELLSALLSLHDESRHEFVIFSPYSKNISSLSSLSDSRIPWITIPNNNSLHHYFQHLYNYVGNYFPIVFKSGKGYKRLESIFHRSGVDVMIFFSPMHPVIDIPYITTVWDLEHKKQPWFPEVSNTGEFEHREIAYLRILKRASYILTGTNAGRDEIVRYYNIDPSRIRVIPFPTPRVIVTQSKKDEIDLFKKYGIPRDYLFYPAQFWPHKNHINLLLAMKELKEKYHLNIPAVFVGSDKGNRRYVKEMINDLGLSSSVHMLDFVPRDDLVKLYQNAFALTFVSFFGPDNLPPLEAFTLGCPVIASDVAGAREQLEDTAILVDPKSPSEIASAIKTLHGNNDLRNAHIQKGVERAKKWTGIEYIRSLSTILDEFENVRHCWGKL